MTSPKTGLPVVAERASAIGESVQVESARLQALARLEVMDSEREAEFDELVELAAAICGTPIGLISLLDDHRQWFKASVGVNLRETPRELAFCTHAIQQTELFMVEDAHKDLRFSSNPMVTGDQHVQFYAGVPLRTRDGLAMGTLCVIDRKPRQLTTLQQNALCVLARQVSTRLESRLRQREFTTAKAELERYQAELETANDRLRNLSVTDPLTGLRNRRAFEERLTFEFAMARRKNRNLSVVLIDVDDFKKVNDRLGHPAGDAVLQMVGKVLQETVRVTDLTARYGGEEFAVLLPESDEDSALHWCKRLQNALTQATWDHDPITVSMGAAGLDTTCADGASMVSRADQALYRAKRKGKNCAVGSAPVRRNIAG